MESNQRNIKQQLIAVVASSLALFTIAMLIPAQPTHAEEIAVAPVDTIKAVPAKPIPAVDAIRPIKPVSPVPAVPPIDTIVPKAPAVPDTAKLPKKVRAQMKEMEKNARELVNGEDDLTVSVLGDSTGNEPGEWVGLWSEALAADGATVELHLWNGEGKTWEDDPTIIGNGSRLITIWNASHAGASADYPIENPEMFPETADLVITNYGHNGNASTTRATLSNLLDATGERWGEAPTVVTVQNPATGEAESNSAANQEVVREVAAGRALPIIDVHAAFTDAGGVDDLLVDDVHPAPAGSRLWAEAVSNFFE